MKRQDVIFKLGRKGDVLTFVDGKPAFPGREWRLPLPNPGERWEVEVAGKNARGTVYFLRPIRKVEPRVVREGDSVVRRYEYVRRLMEDGHTCRVCGAPAYNAAWDNADLDAGIIRVCGVCLEDRNPPLRPAWDRDGRYLVVRHKLRRNVRNTYGGGTFGEGANLSRVAYTYGDEQATNVLTYRAHGSQHVVYEVVRETDFLPPYGVAVEEYIAAREEAARVAAEREKARREAEALASADAELGEWLAEYGVSSFEEMKTGFEAAMPMLRLVREYLPRLATWVVKAVKTDDPTAWRVDVMALRPRRWASCNASPDDPFGARVCQRRRRALAEFRSRGLTGGALLAAIIEREYGHV